MVELVKLLDSVRLDVDATADTPYVVPSIKIFHPATPTSDAGNSAALVTVVLPFVALTMIERDAPAAGNIALDTVEADTVMSVADTLRPRANTASSTSSSLNFIEV